MNQQSLLLEDKVSILKEASCNRKRIKIEKYIQIVYAFLRHGPVSFNTPMGCLEPR